MSHHSLPIGISVSRISPFGISCPWCPTTPNSISHLFHSCSHASLIWDKISLLCSFISSYHPSPINFISSSQPYFKKLGRLLQSAAIFSKWKDYTLCTFGSSPVPSSYNSLKSLLHLVLSYRFLHLFSSPKVPWPSISCISSLLSPPLPLHLQNL